MRRRMTIAVLLCIAPVICLAQQSSHKLSDYAGTWQANFRGTPFITINLIEKDGHLTGSAGVGDINATPSGEITNVEAPANESPIVSNRLLDSGDLELTSRGDDPADKIILVLELTGQNWFCPIRHRNGSRRNGSQTNCRAENRAKNVAYMAITEIIAHYLSLR